MNKLYYGDNLEILKKYIPDESVDLIYLDPPFNSQRAYNVIFHDQTGKEPASQIQAFEDTWTWGSDTQDAFDAIMEGKYPPELKDMMKAFKDFMGTTNLMAYLTMMAIRLVELRRVLKETGSLYLHCDPSASHYLKILLDQAFDILNFNNEIIWKRTFAHGSSKRYGPVHDVILFYRKGNNCVWTYPVIPHDTNYVKEYYKHIDEKTGRKFQAISLTGAGKRKGDSGKPWKGINPTLLGRHWALPGRLLKRLQISPELTTQQKLDQLDSMDYIFWPAKEKGTPRLKWYADELLGEAISDIWNDIPPVSSKGKERLGYPTQKPVSLLERIIQASSNEGDIVLDPFCGCGTAVAAAEKLGRKWIGIDITYLAIALIKKRIVDHFPDAKFEIVGEPKSAEDAKQLFLQSPFQFESWAVSLLEGQPYKSAGGGDTGIDGLLYFKDYKEKHHKIIIEVKGGGYNPKDVRALKAVIKRESAPLGVLLALKKPTKGMLTEAAEAGKWQMPGSKRSFPVIQIVTIENFLTGKRPELPDTSGTLKKAKRQKRDTEENQDMFE